MHKPNAVPELTAEQVKALDDSHGVVQGESFVLMRTDVVLDWFGYTHDQLRDELQPAIEQADRRELVEWDLQGFLSEMHRQHDAKTG